MSLEPNAVGLLIDLHNKDGAPPLAFLPGLWERRIDDQWAVWVNGHPTSMKLPSGGELAPYDCYVQFNGWPAGIFSMATGEGSFAAGRIANYEKFLEAITKALGT